MQRHVRSIEQLELLLLLHAQPERWWSAEAAAAELRTARAPTAARLEEMAARNLLDVRTAERLLFRYHPASPAVHEALLEIARLTDPRGG